MNETADRPSEPDRPASAARRCPICGKSAARESRPFCSRRCADIDLGRWLGGNYRVAGRPPDEDDADLPVEEPPEGRGARPDG
jgi:hypothetical protein